MGKKELRKMSRLELMEIIYQQQQAEKELREELELQQLKAKKQESKGKNEFSGTIPEVVDNLNRVLNAVQESASEYSATVQMSLKPTGRANQGPSRAVVLAQVQEEADKLMEQAHQEADKLMEQAREQAHQEGVRLLAEVKAQTQQRADQLLEEMRVKAQGQADELLEQSRAQAEQEREQIVYQAAQEILRLKAGFLEDVKATLNRYPELARKMREEKSRSTEN